MAEYRFAEIVILAEDRVHVRFIRSWLTTYVSYRAIRDRLPKGGGSGEQFVRDQFGIEAELHRRNSSKRGSMLIGVIDADTGDFQAHYRELMEKAAKPDGIFVFVPKRSIETWLHQLNGHIANEDDSYKLIYKKDPSEAIRAAGRAFVKLLLGEPSLDDLLPSLAFGVVEARRIPRVHQPPPQ